VDIARKNRQVSVLIHQDTLVPALIEMACSVVATVVITGVGDIEVTHEFGEIAQGCLYQQMEVVGHDDIAAQLDAVDVEGLDEVFKKASSVGVVFKDVLLFVPSAGDVIHGTGILDAKRPSHEGLIA
jgi:hypothetical protein